MALILNFTNELFGLFSGMQRQQIALGINKPGEVAMLRRNECFWKQDFSARFFHAIQYNVKI